MPPKQRITREMILDKTFDMFCKGGLDTVNARSVARALNCSTQPIFSYFSGMEDLKDSVEAKAQETYQQMVVMPTDAQNRLQTICVQYAGFAAKMPAVFEHLFMRHNSREVNVVCSMEQRAELAAEESAANGISEEAAAFVVEELCNYTHGLAALLMRGFMQEDEAGERIARMYGMLVEKAGK